MTTYADVQALILGDLHRDDLTTQVQTAMANAVTELRMERLYFTEYQTSFTATLTCNYAVDTVLPSLLEMDTIRVWDNGSPLRLSRVPWQDLADTDETLVTGTPSAWAVHHRMLRLYPTPDSTCSIEVSGLKDLSLSAWCSYAPTLVRATAQIELYTLVLHDEQAAARAAAYAQREKAKLLRRLPSIASGGELRPYL
ncbi:MAG: hypothetical protein NHG36_07915 [Chromatiaceae bacterium]|nr:hypothetical protein [Candidatus Thioaporhodococcus sediminis]